MSRYIRIKNFSVFIFQTSDQENSSNTASKNKWKDTLLNFLHTLNLLIGMCENALETVPDTKEEEIPQPNVSEPTNETTEG